EDWTLDTGGRVIELSRAGLGVLATEPGFMVLGDETAVADAGTVPALLLTDDEAVPSSEFFGLTLRQGDEVVDSVDFNNRVVDPAVSFQRCPADDGSGIFEIKRALDPSPGQANGCVEPARPECTDVCCESVGVPCDDFDDGYLKASNSGREDHFGYAVAVSGDTLAVGAPQESSNSTGVNGDEDNNDAVRSGAVYVFTRSGGRWSQQAYVKASNTGSRTFEGDAFGAAIALDGDTLVVGAPGEESIATGVNGDQDDNTSRDHGAAYVFVRSGTTWTQQAYLKASNTSDVFAGFGGDGFGSTVAIQGDTVVVGAFLEDGGSPGIDGDDANDDVRDSGAVYVFTRSTLGRWAQSAYIKSSDPGEQDYFGAAVALDGRALVVGAPGDDRTRESGGAAYVFERSGGSWAEVDVLESSVEGLFFGATVAIDGGRIAVGQRDTRRPDGSPVFFNRIGRVVLFERASAGPDPWLESATLQSPFVEDSLRGAYNEFGFNSSVIEGERASHTTLVLDGDLLIVGDTFDRFGSGGLNGSRTAELDRAGSVFVFRLVEGVWEETAFIKASNVDAGDRFGVVAYDRGTLAIGAIWEDSAATGVGGSQSNDSLPGAGAVYVRRVQLPEPPESP
ncbi:MAG TPA: hypothetical protein RMF84_14270, partial [Polyangiaceae bacterium LLY-WYZ-14_1]|nr:hypothetical protein [Polyangiaceae bacterium LLY-WYZ-14_1]